MVMLAFAMMAAIRHRANPLPPKKTKRRTTAKTNASPLDSLESESNPHISLHGHSGVELTKPQPNVRTSKQNGNCNAKPAVTTAPPPHFSSSRSIFVLSFVMSIATPLTAANTMT